MSNNSVRRQARNSYTTSNGRGDQGFLPVSLPKSKIAQENWNKYNTKKR